jgi:hypothetical protein
MGWTNQAGMGIPRTVLPVRRIGDEKQEKAKMKKYFVSFTSIPKLKTQRSTDAVMKVSGIF